MRVLIMGGTSGIGLATAEMLTGDGAEVTVTGRDLDKLDRARARVARAEQLDGTDRAAVSTFLERFGSFEHLMLAFSPGPIGMGPVKETNFDDFETAITGKLLPYVYAIREAQVTESITMISASSARAAFPGTVALTAANGAIERIVSPLAAELAPIRVNAVSPGIVDTPWWSFLSDEDRAAQFKQWNSLVPAGRVATGQDVAEAVRYLIHASLITGTIMPVDGGYTVA
jgi:NAD(P)-dependent dehydrogenase (short-subunit alcohol dehydrogenase family)